MTTSNAPTAGQTVHVNSATLIMGPTGSGKTTLLATLAMYVWETFHKISLFYTTDGGGFPTTMQALIQRGIVRGFRMRTRDLPDGSLSFETCLRSAQGWWPEVIDPASCEVEPGVRMIPPVTDQYTMRCPNGHVVKIVPFQSLLTPSQCPICKVHTTKENMKVAKVSARTPGFEDVGCVMLDGISSMMSWMLSDMSMRAGRLELKGEEGAIGGKVVSGDLKLGGSTRSHVGFAQSRGEELVLNALSIPHLVVPPVFTALTLETVDEGGLSVRGPKLAGKAKTDEAPAWFGNCLETAVVKNDKDERIFRLYLSEYTDDAGVRHLCKHRGAAGTMPMYLEDPPLKAGTEADTALTEFNLGRFFELSDQGLKTTMERIAAKYPDAPGLPAGAVRVGGGGATASVSPAATSRAPAAQGLPAGAVRVGGGAPAVAATPAAQPTAVPQAGTQAPAAPTSTKPAQPQAQPPKPTAARPAQPQARPAPARPAAPRPASGKAPAPAAAPAPPAAVSAPPEAVAPPAAAPAQPVEVPVVGDQTPQRTAPAVAQPKPGWARPGAPRPPARAPQVGGRTK